ncbi:hypothetical protein Pelo_18618 [Pelomyxa schiedti]|nr:hypothetical protein Pelo_18618 [Pelomyxa schiedti]
MEGQTTLSVVNNDQEGITKKCMHTNINTCSQCCMHIIAVFIQELDNDQLRAASLEVHKRDWNHSLREAINWEKERLHQQQAENIEGKLN